MASAPRPLFPISIEYVTVWRNETFREIRCSPDGKWFTLTFADGTVERYCSRTAEQLCEFRVFLRRNAMARISPDEMAFAYDTTVNGIATVLMEQKSRRKHLSPFRRGVCTTVDIVWSPDGKRLATMFYGGQVVLTDVYTMHHTKLESAFGPAEARLAWSPNSQYLVASYSSGGLMLWDVIGGSPHKQFSIFATGGAMAWSPDGRIFACGSKTRVQLWNFKAAESGSVKFEKVMESNGGSTGEIHHLAWSQDGRFLAAASCSVAHISVWDIEKMCIVATMKNGPVDIVDAMAWSETTLITVCKRPYNRLVVTLRHF